MKRMLLMLALVMSVVDMPVRAQLSDTVNQHFIIAVDGRMPSQYIQRVQSDLTRRQVKQVVDKLRKTDNVFLSVVSYQLPTVNPDFDVFAWIPSSSGGQRLSWLPCENGFIAVSDWGDIMRQHSQTFHIGNGWSFQAAAKQYVVRAAKAPDGRMANETWLLMLTDEKVNGIDDNYRKEWEEIHTCEVGGQVRARMKNPEYEKAMTDMLESVNEIFIFSKVAEEVLMTGGSTPLKLVVYRLRLRMPKSLYSIARVPSQLPIRRIRGGYDFTLDLTSIDSCYEVRRLELTVGRTIQRYVSDGAVMRQTIDGAYLAEGDSVTLRAWLHYKDGVYGGTVMNPYDSEYESIITVGQEVYLSDNAKIFGKIPVPDWLWWFSPDSIQTIVIFWDVVLILVFIIIVCIIAYLIFNKITRYVPSNDKIKIKKIDGNNH